MGKSTRVFGQQAPPPGIYRDEPDRDDAASQSSAMSLHSNIDFDESDETPPPYSDEPTIITTPSSSSNLLEDSLAVNPEIMNPEDRLIKHCDKKGSTSTWLSGTLTTDPRLLQQFVNHKKKVCPEAYITIRGEHYESKGQGKDKKKETKVDFDIKLDVTSTISPGEILDPNGRTAAESRIVTAGNHTKTYRGTVLQTLPKKSRADMEGAHEKPTLEEWCHLFCASSSKLKSFTIRHRLLDRNEKYLRSQIEAFVRSTNYRGRITVDFQLCPRTITVQTPHVFNKMRNNKFVYFLFIILQLWIITWPLLFFMTKRWAVIWVDLPYNLQAHIDGQERPLGTETPKESEEQWLRRYRYTVQQGALSRAVNGTIIDYLDEEVHLPRGRDSRARDAEPQEGLVGGALSLMRGVGNIIRETNEARGWGNDT